MLKVLPETLTIQHKMWVPDGGTDHRGNPTGAYAAPISRKVIGFYRPGSTDPVSLEFVARTISELIMLVYQPTLYNKLDRVLAFDGAQTLSYEVQGQPMSWATGYPWQHYAPLLGGEITIKRVE